MTEVELKLLIKNKNEIIRRLLHMGAKLKSRKKQTDILFNSKYFDFGKLDQGLRLRVEKDDNTSQAFLAFKGTPSHSIDGHKTRDEFETPVDFEPTRKLINSIGFKEVVLIEKGRESYLLDTLHIDIDETKFGTFIEFEGPPQEMKNGNPDTVNQIPLEPILPLNSLISPSSPSTIFLYTINSVYRSSEMELSCFTPRKFLFFSK